MLVLSRQKNESILIGDDVDITVVDIRGDKVRLGIKAPREVNVHRKEVYDAIKRENQLAAGVKPEDLPGMGTAMKSAPIVSAPTGATVVPSKKAVPIKLAVLVSGSGTTLQNLLDQIGAGRLNAKVEVVIGSKPGLLGVERALRANVRGEVVDKKSFATSAQFSERVFQLCDEAGVDLICLAGWLCLIDVPQRWAGRVMNIHPALLPAFGGKGMYGRKVHEVVLAHGCKVSGCTVHFVDNTYDTGPIILQRTCDVQDRDTPESLAARVFEQEKIAYPYAIELFASNRLTVTGRHVTINASRT